MKIGAQDGVKVMSTLLTARPNTQDELLQTLMSLKTEILRQPGCLDCTIGRAIDGTPRFQLFTVWQEPASLDAHLASEVFRVLLGATTVLTVPDDFRFTTADSAF